MNASDEVPAMMLAGGRVAKKRFSWSLFEAVRHPSIGGIGTWTETLEQLSHILFHQMSPQEQSTPIMPDCLNSQSGVLMGESGFLMGSDGGV